IFGVIRGEQWPQPLFWLFALLGSSGVMGFMLLKVQGENSMSGNLWMLAAITVCGLGYAEGGKLSRQLGGWQVISWALVISLPLMLILSYVYLPQSFSQITISELLALLYVAFFSMF
ncbi:MAG TPA: EamA/RhaT family transporter, partial [Acinetobacter radioresistens]|nr:EamA/RhaT family transporter [Acinetobacter radioresistens]